MNLTPIIPDDVIQELKQNFGNDYNWHNACDRPHVVQSGDLIQIAWLFYRGCYNPEDNILYDLRSIDFMRSRRLYYRFVVTLEDKYIKTNMNRYVIAVKRLAEMNLQYLIDQFSLPEFLFDLLPDFAQISDEYKARNH